MACSPRRPNSTICGQLGPAPRSGVLVAMEKVPVSQLGNRVTFATVHVMAPAASCVAIPLALGPDSVTD